MDAWRQGSSRTTRAGRTATTVGSLVIGALLTGLLAGCDAPPGAEGTIAPGDPYAERVRAACEQSLTRTDCTCFWTKAQPAFTRANVDGILQALAERDTYGPAITRARLEQVAGKEGNSIIGRALFDCTRR